ncbi:hypothetical protein P152DRAFT_458330 [Eremomyces bilateralis CBS 781.70]|uniref:Uncharacterized protein n=1 Tax=Eremomyces bilateralis CBS 781.70 TaxID=1392243 RepID=A0A6G1G3A1_9PEZI|nr:uncharacterized protein P152DRAFT_458330 [Eremomyces bilateralis CBS 781.70]KAF1812488.1 hypothetical protein P152DRAFT_458330 [Eremomyces bilateralis CBS 781.70]
MVMLHPLMGPTLFRGVGSCALKLFILRRFTAGTQMNGTASDAKAERKTAVKIAVKTAAPEPKVLYPCESLDQLQLLLEHLHQNATQSLIPESVLFQASFTTEVVFDASNPAAEAASTTKSPDGTPRTTWDFDIPPSISVEDVVSDFKSEEQKLEMRKAVLKSLIAGIDKGDDFAYQKSHEWQNQAISAFCYKFLCKSSLVARSRTRRAKRTENGD